MAGSRTGTPTIWNAAREITRLKNKYGAADMSAKLGADFAACIDALVTCTLVVLTTDDFVLKIDRTAPAGPEDIGVP
jgi:hypothetical protein